MKRVLTIFLALVVALVTMPFTMPLTEVSAATGLIKKFDLGGLGAASGYIGVSASEGYSKSKGYGFSYTSYVKNVSSSGSGANNDAVRFSTSVNDNFFNVDLDKGVYKITVTAGNVKNIAIIAEGQRQLNALAGNNASDSFIIPVTDGQLNIYPTYGSGSDFSISAIEIEQISTNTTTMPTIWICGDDTSANHYISDDNGPHGWGEYLGDFVDTSKYYVRNISAGEDTANVISNSTFKTAEYYGKSGDIILIAAGAYDHIKQELKHVDTYDPTEYIAAMTDMVRRAKAKGMTVYLVKQYGLTDDCAQYPLVYSKWFGEEIDAIATSEKVGVIDLYRLWLEFCLEQNIRIANGYYAYGINTNLRGARKVAQIIGEQLFPVQVSMDNNYDKIIAENIDFKTVKNAYYYETEVSGGPVSNPHKGFIMSVDNPLMFTNLYEFGIGGLYDNQAWNLTTVCSGYYKWKDLNPAKGTYNWDPIEDMLKACEEHGMTCGIRILPYSSYDGDHTDNYGAKHDYVPAWVYAEGAEKVRVPLNSNPSVYIDVPKWDDIHYLQACKDFALALANKYDGDPRIEFIDIRPFGDWGEWHFSSSSAVKLPSVDVQNEMVQFYRDCFDKTLLCITSGAYGEVYDNALSLGITKRDDGLIATPNTEWGLRLAYKANLPTLGENYLPYHYMLDPDTYGTGPVNNYDTYLVRWTPERFREVIEIAHLSMFQLDQDSDCGYYIYEEQKDVVEEMCNRLGYNFTVTSAIRYDNKLVVSIKNTGLASAFFDIQLCAEITDANGNKISNFGQPVLIPTGSFHDEMEKTFVFEFDGTIPSDSAICLSMYDINNSLVKGKDPTVRFDNKNTLPNNRLLLVEVKHEVINTATPTPVATPTSGIIIGVVPTYAPDATPGPIPTVRPTLAPTSTPSNAPSSSKSVSDFVTRCYSVALSRKPDDEGFKYWVDSLTGGAACGAQVGYGFIFSGEYINKNRSDEDFVRDLYSMYFGRTPDADGFNYWVGLLASGITREEVFAGFANSLEFYNLCFEYGVVAGVYLTGIPNDQQGGVNCFVARLYKVCLNRLPDMGGHAGWVLQLMEGKVTGTSLSFGFVFSPEFMGQGMTNEEFVAYMYRAFFGREPDIEGFNSWVTKLNKGASYEEVFQGFSGSAEFYNLCSTFGITPS
ncbi:MAG: DUF4214 domain-containing protein [Clostridia bacterium]|nr:DUF4214 domain-containing protein [Clostridia bacterium]